MFEGWKERIVFLEEEFTLHGRSHGYLGRVDGEWFNGNSHQWLELMSLKFFPMRPFPAIARHSSAFVMD